MKSFVSVPSLGRTSLQSFVCVCVFYLFVCLFVLFVCVMFVSVRCHAFQSKQDPQKALTKQSTDGSLKDGKEASPQDGAHQHDAHEQTARRNEEQREMEEFSFK